MINWYQIFWWLTVADGLKHFFDGASNFFTGAAVVTIIGLIISSCIEAGQISEYGIADKDAKIAGLWKKTFKTFSILSFILMFISWTFYVIIPTKKDALIIIAGGAVGNFITRDSSSKQIPSNIMLLLNTKIKEELKNTSLKEIITDNADTLKNKSKEELENIIRNKGN